MQLAQTPTIFINSKSLFINKWTNNSDETVFSFLIYLKDNWLDKNSNWFEYWNRPDVCCASTNNDNEATNRVTKAEDTTRIVTEWTVFRCK